MKIGILFLFILEFSSYVFGSYVVGGYFPNWSGDLACHGLPVSNFDPSPYTHIWYAFGGVNTGSWMPTADNVLNQLAALKKNHPKLNVLISLGGGGQDGFFASLVSSSENRQKFVNNLIPWLRKNNLDGVDYDWEFPSGQQATDFAQLLADTRAAITKEHVSSNKTALILTVASFGDADDLHTWPLAKMAESLDWFNMMTYEEHGPWDKSTPTGINSPIKSSDSYDITGCVAGYIKAGVPTSKMALGAPSFGHSWYLKDPSQHGINAPGAGAGPQGKCTTTAGYLAYWEVKSEYITQGATVVWDATSQTPYLYKGNVWVSYDNPASYAAKANYTVHNQLRGLFMWDIDEDDNNELINAAVSVFQKTN